jgi:soluble lytic murein transglycosylase-like protein
MDMSIGGFIQSKFVEIQSRVPVRLAGFSSGDGTEAQAQASASAPASSETAASAGSALSAAQASSALQASALQASAAGLAGGDALASAQAALDSASSASQSLLSTAALSFSEQLAKSMEAQAAAGAQAQAAERADAGAGAGGATPAYAAQSGALGAGQGNVPAAGQSGAQGAANGSALGVAQGAASGGALGAAAQSQAAMMRPVIFPNIVPAPPPEPEEAAAAPASEYGGYDEYGEYGEYSEYGGLGEYGAYGEYGYAEAGALESGVGSADSLDANIAYINKYGDAEIRASIMDAISRASAAYGVDENLIKAVITQESAFSPTSLSSAGAQGLMQLMPDTADALGVSNVWDIGQNIDGGTRLLRRYIDAYGGDLPLVLAAYNAGPGAVEKYGGVPPYSETQDYVEKVSAYYGKYRAEL